MTGDRPPRTAAGSGMRYPDPPQPAVRGRRPAATPPDDPDGDAATGRGTDAGRGAGAEAGRGTGAGAGVVSRTGPRAANRGSARRPPSGAARAHRRRGLRRLAVLVAAVAGAALLAYLLLVSSVLGVRSVAVVGTGVLSADEVSAAASVPAGQPMLRVDLDAVAGRVRALRPVDSVRVERSWPSTVVVRIAERVPVAFVPVAGGALLVDAGGLEFATVASPPPGVPELRTGGGEATAAAATVLATLGQPGREGLRAELVAVNAGSPLDVQLTLRGDRTVRWGSARDSDRKAAVLAVLLTQPGTVYDVASPDLPTIR